MENEKKDLERIGSFSVPPSSFRDRALRIAATAERVLFRIGKIGLVLVVVTTATMAFGNREEAEDLNRQVDFLWKTAYSPDRSWVARELVFRGGTDLLPGPAVPTGKFVCGKAGSIPKECTPVRLLPESPSCASSPGPPTVGRRPSGRPGRSRMNSGRPGFARSRSCIRKNDDPDAGDPGCRRRRQSREAEGGRDKYAVSPTPDAPLGGLEAKEEKRKQKPEIGSRW